MGLGSDPPDPRVARVAPFIFPVLSLVAVRLRLAYGDAPRCARSLEDQSFRAHPSSGSGGGGSTYRALAFHLYGPGDLLVSRGFPHARPSEGPAPVLQQAIDLYHEGDRQRVSEAVAHALAVGQPFAFEARIVRPDGSIRHVATQGERDYSSRDDAIGLFGLIRDVTEQIEARQVLQDSRDAANRSAAAAMLLASTDVLTGLANRRGIVEHLDVTLADTDIGKTALSVILFDIDHFKAVNDRYGHDVGDEVLKRVASSANACLRHTDLIGRYGGEEFVIILPSTDAEVALQIAERVRARIEASWDARQPKVTVSLGIASTRGEDAGDVVLKRADIALYEAKSAGRNRLRLAL